MRHIYARASCVLIWLGKETDTVAEAFEMIKLCDECYEADNLQDVQAVILQPSTSSKWQAVSTLLNRSWFQRVWVIQEVAMASEALIVCGRYTCDWESISRLVRFLRKHSISGYIGMSTTVRVMVNMRIQIQEEGPLHEPIFQLIAYTREFHATDPRDRAFALLGLISDVFRFGVRIDYAMSYEDVYKEIALKALGGDGDFMFPLLSRAGYHPRGSAKLPSWAPDWTLGLLNYMNPLTNDRFRASGPAKAGVSISQAEGDDNMLTIMGFVFDTIQRVSERRMGDDVLSASDNPAPRQAPGAWEWMIDLARVAKTTFEEIDDIASVATSYPTGQDFWDAYSRIFLCDEPLDLEGLDVDPETSILEGYKIQRYKQSHIEDITAGRADQLDLTFLARNNEIGLRYEEKMTEQLIGKKFCATSKRYLGWVPPSAEPGDIVCIFFGSKVPFLLRTGGSGFYKLIGECYIHGIMKGEAVVEGDLVEQKFQII